MCFCFYDADMSTSRTICASPCLAISAANSDVKPSSLQVILSPSIPAPEGVPITAIVIPLALGGILSILVAVTIIIVLRAKWQKKKTIDLLEQDFQRR